MYCVFLLCFVLCRVARSSAGVAVHVVVTVDIVVVVVCVVVLLLCRTCIVIVLLMHCCMAAAVFLQFPWRGVCLDFGDVVVYVACVVVACVCVCFCSSVIVAAVGL